MRGTLGLVMSLLCRPVTVAGAFIIVMTGLYVLEKIPANMPFVGFIVIAISASVFLLDGRGRFVGTIDYGENPDVAVQKLKNLMTRAS